MKIYLIFICLLSFGIQARFFEKDYYLDSNKFEAGQGLTKKDAKKVIRLIKREFKKETLLKVGFLGINDVWWSKVINAYAMKYGPIWRITVHGGFLKHPLMNKRLLSLVLCHELGHFLGGAPKLGIALRKWSSLEGQADYWAALKCMKRVLHRDPSLMVYDNINSRELVVSECNSRYDTKEDQKICYNISMIGLEMGNIIAKIKNVANPEIETPDLSEVDQTDTEHPKFQCRVDTYFAGALCSTDKRVSKKDPLIGTCNEFQGDTIGVRPHCWYAPLK